MRADFAIQDALDTKKNEFQFHDKKEVQEIFARYPKDKKRSAIMPLLRLAQEENNNWIPFGAIMYIAKLLDMKEVEVLSVVTFYEEFNLKPVGKVTISVCRTTPCWLNGSDNTLQIFKEELCIDVGETTKDGLFTLKEIECLGACTSAPVVKVNDDYHCFVFEKDKIVKLIQELRDGNEAKEVACKE